MTTLTQASRQWSSRPADERFLSLTELRNKLAGERQRSISTVVSSRSIKVQPHPMDPIKGITIAGSDTLVDPTHWAFGQLASLAGAPANYLRKLPAPLVADAINFGLRFMREPEEIGILHTAGEAVTKDGRILEHTTLRAATGPRYFVFLADEENRIEVPNRRFGRPGSLARGFFVWNSEVGSQSIGAAFFLFDYVCMNRIVWGVQEYKEIRLRHSKNAPDRWLEEITPVLMAYSKASARPIVETIREAQRKRVDQDLDRFLRDRFTAAEAKAIQAAHQREEGRPIETIWDVVTAATALARTIRYQDTRVDLERKGGKLLDLVAA